LKRRVKAPKDEQPSVAERWAVFRAAMQPEIDRLLRGDPDGPWCPLFPKPKGRPRKRGMRK